MKSTLEQLREKAEDAIAYLFFHANDIREERDELSDSLKEAIERVQDLEDELSAYKESKEE
jgi:hypothetical protein